MGDEWVHVCIISVLCSLSLIVSACMFAHFFAVIQTWCLSLQDVTAITQHVSMETSSAEPVQSSGVHDKEKKIVSYRLTVILPGSCCHSIQGCQIWEGCSTSFTVLVPKLSVSSSVNLFFWWLPSSNSNLPLHQSDCTSFDWVLQTDRRFLKTISRLTSFRATVFMILQKLRLLHKSISSRPVIVNPIDQHLQHRPRTESQAQDPLHFPQASAMYAAAKLTSQH